MVLNYKKIGDELTLNELNGYASLLAHNKTLTEDLHLKHGEIQGLYGSYVVDLSHASIVDNGILVSSDTITNGLTVTLINGSRNATYTMSLTILRYENVSILDEDTEDYEIIPISIVLENGVETPIPATDLEPYDVILFDTVVSIKHDRPEISGEFPVDIGVDFAKSIIQSGETNDICATVLSNLGNGMEGYRVYFYEEFVPESMRLSSSASIFEVGDSVTFTGRLVDEDGSSIEGEEVVFTQKDKVLFRDGGINGDNNDKWWHTQNSASKSLDNEGRTLDNRTSQSGYSLYYVFFTDTLPSTWSERIASTKYITFPATIEFTLISCNNYDTVGIFMGEQTRGNLTEFGISANSNVRFEIDIDGNCKCYVDNVLQSRSFDISMNPSNFAFNVPNGYYVKIKDFFVKIDVSLGSDTTDEHGEATVSYTPTGQGVMNVVSDCGVLESGTNVLDCISIDNGTTSSHNDIWKTNDTLYTLTRNNEYTVLKEITSTDWSNLYLLQDIVPNTRIEFDIKQIDGDNISFFWGLSKTKTTGYLNGGSVANMGYDLNEWIHCTLDITSTTATMIANNDSSHVRQFSYDSLSSIAFQLWLSRNISELHFKNVKIYKIP